VTPSASESLFEAAFSFEMAEDTEESRNDPPVAIRAVFALTYKVENLASFSDEELQAFGEINGVLNAWPFWRELVYSTLSRMGMPPVTLPTFRVIPTPEEQSTEKTNA
jgi:preprotein translocase subunit SecB